MIIRWKNEVHLEVVTNYDEGDVLLTPQQRCLMPTRQWK